MSFSVSKKNGKLIFKDNGGYETRNPSTAWCIQEADKNYNWNDFNEIQIFTSDFEKNNNEYTYSKQNSYNKVVPDFNFHSWPEVGINDYNAFIQDIDNSGLTSYEINKVAWIGNANTNKLRTKMLEIGEKNKEFFDFFSMKWIKTNGKLLQSTIYISTPDLVKKYSILIDIEGNGYSGRLKHLLWSHRPVLIVDRQHKEYFFEFLEEWTHYIPVKRDLSDLVEKAKWCIDNYDKAKQIAENAYEFSKIYLTREACYKQWNKIITNI